jgi:hypothetical protein
LYPEVVGVPSGCPSGGAPPISIVRYVIYNNDVFHPLFYFLRICMRKASFPILELFPFTPHAIIATHMMISATFWLEFRIKFFLQIELKNKKILSI